MTKLGLLAAKLKAKAKLIIVLSLAAIAISVMVFKEPSCTKLGCYGPVTLTLVAEDGEQVDDMVLSMSHTTNGWFGTRRFTYDHEMLVNSNEPITFPRGFFYSPKMIDGRTAKVVAANIYVNHFAYEFQENTYGGGRVVFIPSDATGAVDVGVTLIKRKPVRVPKINPETGSCLDPTSIRMRKSQGRSTEQIDRFKKQWCTVSADKLSQFYRYLDRVPESEHLRIVQRYVPQLAEEYANEVQLDDITAEQVKQVLFDKFINKKEVSWYFE